jgi:hypothetical protein
MKFMTNHWRIPNDGIHVFIPFLMNMPLPLELGSILGKSPRPGPCVGDNYADDELNASVVGLYGSEQTASTFAHEVGHYLGLEHTDAVDNLMFPSANINTARQRSKLNEEQLEIIRQHCLVTSSCLLLLS